MSMLKDMLAKHKRSDHEEAFILFQKIAGDKEQLSKLFSSELSQLLRAGALTCYFVSKPDIGLRLIDLYYLLRSNPSRNDCFDNLSFYVSMLGSITGSMITFDNSPTDWMIQDENGVNLSMTNTSSFKWNHKQYMLVRVVNYQIRPNGYHFLDGTNIVKSRYVISQVEENSIVKFQFLTIKEDHEVFDNLAHMYHGLEDLRPLVWRNRIKVFGSSADVHMGKIGIFMADLDPDNMVIENLVPLSFSNGQVEKNWLPFVFQDKLHCIYSLNPLIVLRVYANGTCKEVKRTFLSNSDYALMGHRGGSLIDIGTGYLVMGHYTSPEPLWRYYYRRLLLIDYNFNLISMSEPFCFEKKMIEYSLCLFQKDENCFEIYYSIADQGVKIIKLSKNQIIQMLIPVDQYLDIGSLGSSLGTEDQ